MESVFLKTRPLIDVDCNLLHPDLQQSLLLLDRSDPDDKHQLTSNTNLFHSLSHPSIQRANISAIFSPSSTIEEARIVLLALQKSTTDISSPLPLPIKTSVGVHPFHVLDQSLPPSLDEARQAISAIIKSSIENTHVPSFISCIGETGLDYSEGFPKREEQLPWWEMQVSLALEFQLPLFVHERLAFQDVVHTLEKNIFSVPLYDQQLAPRVPVLIHCFTSSRDECRYYISRGCFISVSGFILRTGSGPDEVRACLREGIIPLDQLMIETDAPYMGFPTCRDLYFEMEGYTFQALSSKQKKRLVKGIYPNVPSSLPKVFDCVVELINEGRKERGSEPFTADYVAQRLFDNSIRFFGFDRTKLKSDK